MRTYRNLASLFALLILLATSVRTQAQSLTKAIPDDPEVPHFITLKSIGGGSFTAEAIVSIDGKNETIKIDTMTTVDLPPKTSLNLIIKPNEGCALTRFTYQNEGSDEVAFEEVPAVVYPDSCIEEYPLTRTRTLRAYFEPYLGVIKNDTISLENATIWQPIIVDDTTTMQTDTSVINLSDVRASVLTVQERANAMFNLKGTNNLDTIKNNGTLIFQAEKDATLSVKRVMNNGVLRDSTGFIRAVEIGVETDVETDAKTGDMLISIETKSKNIIEAQGDSVELPMSYNIIDNSRDNMAYLQGSKWQKLVGDVWEDLPDQKTLLRATTTTANKDVAVENADYRYLLNIKVENFDTKEVKGEATLTTYMSVVALPFVIQNDTLDLENDTIARAIRVERAISSQDTSVINLSGVQAPSLEVLEEANAVLNLKGTNNLDEITNNGTLIIQAEEGATLSIKDVVTNNGILRDSTGLIQAVTIGDVIMSVEGSKDQVAEEGSPVELCAKAIIEVNGDQEPNVSFLWQKLMNGVWVNQTSLRESSTLTVLAENADYRCLITYEVNGSITTLAIYTSVTATDPDPEPTITLTLPAIEGATTTPAAGTYEIEEGEGFSFVIVLDDDYDQSKPIVKVNGRVLEPNADGVYQLTRLFDDVTITIEGIVKNEEDPTSISGVEDNVTKVWSSHGYLHIRSYVAGTAYIISMNGKLHKILTLSEGGETMTAMPQGVYIVRIGGQSYKLRF